MESDFRKSMNWLHTWAGVVLGGLLFAIFWMGTLSVFDREIDRWMAPVLRSVPASEPAALESLRPLYEAAVAAKSPGWTIMMPTDRDPAIRVSWREGAKSVSRFVDPSTGAVMPEADTLGATRFFFPFHYMLHIRLGNIGIWLVGLAGMGMMTLCVAGVIIHRTLIADFFTVRANRKPRRLILDLHNVTGLLGLPFHFLISLSGLIVFFTLYFPGVWDTAYRGDGDRFFAEMYGGARAPKGKEVAPLAPLDGMVAEVRKLWHGASPRYISVRNPGSATSVVQIGRLQENSVQYTYEQASFEGATGRLINRSQSMPAVMSVYRFFVGMHLVQFHHWSLRWIYFALGSLGCLLIATGYLYWIESRRKQHARSGSRGVRFVEGLAIGSITGIVSATLAFFVANRLLPPDSAFAGYDRASLEVWVFYFTWLATFVHGWTRLGRAWAEQCAAIAGLAILAVVLNGLTTGDHPGRSLLHRHLWAVAGMDLVLLAGAAVAVFTARRLRRRATV